SMLTVAGHEAEDEVDVRSLLDRDRLRRRAPHAARRLGDRSRRLPDHQADARSDASPRRSETTPFASAGRTRSKWREVSPRTPHPPTSIAMNRSPRFPPNRKPATVGPVMCASWKATPAAAL